MTRTPGGIDRIKEPDRVFVVAGVPALAAGAGPGMGDFVIVTLEGEDPGHAFEQMMSATDPFTTWFLGKVQEIHGVDLSAPMSGPRSELVIDTERVLVPVR